MDQDAVIFDEVWKRFQIGESHNSLRDLVPALARRFLGRAPAPKKDTDFWAVKDVSFSVGRGQALGIIGPNGAGKSTTLKLLTKILKPTKGRCEVKGRVGALIEIAAGFHPDLTGRENIYLQGAIMGMKRAEITKKLEEIIEFAGVSAFIDTQVKRYSSGMNARLGFAIAAHLDPDVLIIDEVLSVGDMAFQRKCVERMHWFKKQGVSIVFVSHNLQAVSELCDRALYIKGSALALGPPDEVIGKYIENSGSTQAAPTNERVPIVRAALLQDGKITTSVEPGDVLTLRAVYSPRVDAELPTLGFVVFRSTDQFVAYAGHFALQEMGLIRFTAGEDVEVEFNFKANLTRGHYHVEVAAYEHGSLDFLGQLLPAVNFAVHGGAAWGGVAELEVKPVANAIASASVGI